MECIGKGKAAAPYESGEGLHVTTTAGPRAVRAARQGAADNPYDGHTLRDVIDRTETLTGCAIERAYATKVPRP